MKNLYSILESILDDDTVVIQKTEEDTVIDSLLDNGIRYACSKTSTLLQPKDLQIASYKDHKLCFFTEDNSSASDVIIDYKKAKKFLSTLKLKSIEAPRVIIVGTPDDCSIFGTLKVNSLKIVEDFTSTSIKNLDVSLCRQDFTGADYTAINLFNRVSVSYYNELSFNNFLNGLQSKRYIIVDAGYNGVIFQNCDINTDVINVSGEGVEFKNCKGDVNEITVYDASLFDSVNNTKFCRQLFNIFDSEYSFEHYTHNNSTELLTRKTNSLRKLLAYFGNKKYYCPETSPYKVIGSLNKVCGIKGFTGLKVVRFRDNNYAIDFVKEAEYAKRLQAIDRYKYTSNPYTSNHHKLHPLEVTNDKFYCVIVSEK